MTTLPEGFPEVVDMPLAGAEGNVMPKPTEADLKALADQVEQEFAKLNVQA